MKYDEKIIIRDTTSGALGAARQIAFKQSFIGLGAKIGGRHIRG
jgi:hypothetical protein